MLFLNAPVRKDFKEEYALLCAELDSYGIKYEIQYNAIRGHDIVVFKRKGLQASIGFEDYFIRYSKVIINGKEVWLTNHGDDVMDIWYESIPNTGGGCYFEYLSDKAVDQALFEFLDKYGFPCDVKPKQLSLFDFGLGD